MNEVVVEDWYSDDEFLTDYVSDWGFLIALCGSSFFRLVSFML
jgi:hypothetical protein